MKWVNVATDCLHDIKLGFFCTLYCLQVTQMLNDGGAKQDNYMSEMITHAIADDPNADDYSEAKELFELTVVTVNILHNNTEHCSTTLTLNIFVAWTVTLLIWSISE